MLSLSNKHILLGVSGGIAAYKSAELVRRLREAGAEVRVVMTAGATRFITPLTLQALSGQPVRSALFDAEAEAAMGHIELARWADAIMIAPATANCLARLAQGLADDLLTTLCLATRAPVLLAPAMNHAMWTHPATQSNVACLSERGLRICGPASGEQACGEVGPGRMLEPPALLAYLADCFASGALAGLRVVVTAGPTREALDPVRYISNRSSGKMGYAVAAAAREAGAEVALVSGPVALAAPAGVALRRVESAEEMLAATLPLARECDIFIAAAAVADFRPRTPAASKLKRQAGGRSLALEPAADVLASVAALPQAPFCVGFAAQTEDLERHAQMKRLSKGVDMIAANLVGPGLGFDSDENSLLLVWEGGQTRLEQDIKTRLAIRLIECTAQRFRARQATKESHAKHTTENTR